MNFSELLPHMELVHPRGQAPLWQPKSNKEITVGGVPIEDACILMTGTDVRLYLNLMDGAEFRFAVDQPLPVSIKDLVD